MWPDVFYKDTILLQSITLKTLFEEENIDINKYQALVLDTQGSELLVLKGSISILKNIKYIVTEVADFESYKDCCTLKDINKFMNKYGFEEIYRSRFAENTSGGSYFDIIFKKKDIETNK